MVVVVVGWVVVVVRRGCCRSSVVAIVVAGKGGEQLWKLAEKCCAEGGLESNCRGKKRSSRSKGRQGSCGSTVLE